MMLRVGLVQQYYGNYYSADEADHNVGPEEGAKGRANLHYLEREGCTFLTSVFFSSIVTVIW